jgi:hypothetical protein
MLVLVCVMGTLIEFQVFSCKYGLEHDLCMLVLVCVMGTHIEFQDFSRNNGLEQDSYWYQTAGAE